MIKQGTRVLITGGAGFIGSHLCRAVLSAGGSVRVLDDFSTGNRDRLMGLPRLDLIQGDARNAAAVRRAIEGAHAVVHLASCAAATDPARALQVSTGGALNLLELVRAIDKRERPRLLFCSSGAVYGKQHAYVLHEELPPHPGTLDATLACSVEQLARTYRELHGVPVSCLRLFRTFGPDEDPDHPEASVISKFVRAALDGTSPVIFGDGQQTRDFIYVDNVTSAMLAALDAEPDLYNIGSGEAVPLNFLWTLVLELAGKRRRAIEPTYVPAPPWEPQHARPQIGKACKALGWGPSVRLRDGLSRTLHHHQSLRNADPNAWFAPREGATPPRATPTRESTARLIPSLRSPSSPTPTPPPLRQPPRPPREIEIVADDDLLVEEEPKSAENDLDIEWAPVPAVPGMAR